MKKVKTSSALVWIFLFATLLLTVSGSISAAKSADLQQKVWVEFTDRGSWQDLSRTDLVQEARDQGITRECLARRRIEGIPEDSLVTLADLPPAPEYLEVLEQFGCRILRQSRWFNCVSCLVDAGLKAEIATLPFVKRVYPVHSLQATGFSDVEVGRWEGYPPPGPGIDAPGLYGPSYLQNLQVNAVEAHRQGITGRGVIMAVFDSGFELSHEAYRNFNLYAQYDYVDDDDTPGVEPSDTRGQAAHGSGCLSVIAGYQPGNLIGIAHEAGFILAKTENVAREWKQEEDNFVAALEWAERLGARTMSASLSYKGWYVFPDYDGEKPFISRGIDRAFQLGMVCATAMGNEGPQLYTIGAPADAMHDLSCGAVDSTGKIARFSSRGPTSDGRIKPELCAMGVKTACISPFSEHSYSRWNGTSLSTPVLGGVITLVRSAHLDWSAEKTVRALKATASRADRPDPIYGWGIPDVMAAIRYPEAKISVLDNFGNPQDGIMVELLSGENQTRQSKSEQGIADFPNLEEGEWRVRISPLNGWMADDDSEPIRISSPDNLVTEITVTQIEQVRR